VICTIHGAGFGLYGYLPALLQARQQVLLPERYLTRLKTRSDLAHLASEVTWSVDEAYALQHADMVIIAQRPADQVDRLAECLRYPNLRKLLLEKPIAPNVDMAQQMMRELDDSRRQFRIGYILRYTDWAPAVFQWRASTAGKAPLSITWKLRAHHYANNLDVWKRHSSQGGGALRFYGIHLIALLAELGYEITASSIVSADAPDEVKRWSAVMTGSDLPDCSIQLDTDSDEELFSIRSQDASAESGLCIELRDPFGASSGVVDCRVKVLVRLCNDLLLLGESVSYPWYHRAIDLWRQAEELTVRGED
jgi:predicted dehydrogenase